MKHAVVYIIDCSPSMNTPYPRNNHTSLDNNRNDPKAKTQGSRAVATEATDTRLSCAKKAVQSMIAHLMVASKQNEVCVILLKTPTTRHHKIAATVDLDEEDADQIPFPNLTELTNGVTRPSVDLLRRIETIEATSCSEQAARKLRGDFCDGIVLAADALHERTHKKMFQRKIVLVTDAEHTVAMDVSQVLQVIDSLRDMDCGLEVIGLDFETSAEYDQPAAAPSSGQVKQEEDEQDGNHAADKEREGETDDDDDETDAGSEEEEAQYDKIRVYSAKKDREKLLISLTQKTGGKVIAACTLQQILEIDRGKRIPQAMRKKIELRVAPGLTVNARSLNMMKKDSLPSLTDKSVRVDTSKTETAAMMPLVNALGQEMMDDIGTVVGFVDDDQPDRNIPEADQTTAIAYGSDLIPMTVYDFEGLKSSTIDVPHIEILGYMDRTKVSPLYMRGPPAAISGGDSQNACALISGLARALERLDKVAICTFLKTKGSSGPALGGLFPLPEPGVSQPIHLVFLQLPFQSEVRELMMESFDTYLEESDAKFKAKACDDLIDALMLPEGAIESGKVPSPAMRSWNQTMVNRALDPEAKVVDVRTFDEHDPMVTPPVILERALPALDSFHKSFPLAFPKKADTEKNTNKGQGKQVFTYMDYLDA